MYNIRFFVILEIFVQGYEYHNIMILPSGLYRLSYVIFYTNKINLWT